jgi:methionine synthase II (cobalamin-independent)
MHSRTLWKALYATADAPGADSPENSSAYSPQAARQLVETAYAHAPLIFAHDRCVLDVPLEERLQSRTPEYLAWAKAILPVINQSVRDVRARLHIGHQDIRTYLSVATVAAA